MLYGPVVTSTTHPSSLVQLHTPGPHSRDESLSHSHLHTSLLPTRTPTCIHSRSYIHIHNPQPIQIRIRIQNPQIHIHIDQVTSMPLDTWLSRVTCRRCGVPACRVPLMSYPFAYPPNCEATFQAINSNSSQNPPRTPPLKLHHLMLPQADNHNHNQRPRRPDMSTTLGVQVAIALLLSVSKEIGEHELDQA